MRRNMLRKLWTRSFISSRLAVWREHVGYVHIIDNGAYYDMGTVNARRKQYEDDS
jgi:hypothetical protein